MAHRFRESTGPPWLPKRVRLSLLAVALSLLIGVAGLALSGAWLVSAQSSDFDAEAEDIRLAPSTVYSGQLGSINARFQNLSPSSGPHGGEATFDVSIVVEPPTGTATRFSWDNEVFTLDQERTFNKAHTFAEAGTYTIRAEIYDINGQQSGWNADNRFDQLTETFSVREPVTVQISPSSYTVDEDDGEAEITVTISASPPESFSVGVRTSDGTAAEFSDYDNSTFSVSFSSGTTTLTQTFTVTIVDDSWVEPDESFTVELQPIIGGLPSSVSLARSEATVKILDDDEATVGFERSSLSVTEANRFEVEVEVESDVCPVTVPFEVHMSHTAPDGTSSSGSSVPSSVTFESCRNRAAFLVNIDDLSGTGTGLLTGTTEAVFTLDSVTSAYSGVASRVKIGETSTQTVTIEDDDSASVRFNFTYFITLEREQFDLCVTTFGIDSPTIGRPFTVHFSHTDPDGALSTGSTVPSSVTLNAGDTEGCATIHIGDVASEPGDASVVFTLDSVTSAGSDVASRVSIDEHRSTSVLEVHNRDRPPGPGPTNRAPTVSRVSPSAASITLETGATQTFTARATDPDGNISAWEWSVKGQSQGGQSLELTGSISRTFSHTFSTAGNYPVRVTFTDDEGASGSVSWSVWGGVQSSRTINVTVASSPSGRTVTADGTDYTTPHTATWQSGSSHSLNAPSPQNAPGNRRYVFSGWGHGGSQSQTVAPTGDTTYTANFTLQHFVSTRTEPRGIGINGAGWYDHGATARVGPAPDIDGYDFSHWRRNYQNIGSDLAGVSVTIDTAPFLVEAIYTVSSTVGPPSVSIVSPLTSTPLDPGDSQTFDARATDPDNNISEWEWSVNGESQGGESLAPSGDITRTFTHTFSTAGIHSVQVTFTDTKGGSDSVFWTLQVDGPPPPSVSIVSPLGPIFLEPGDSQTFEVKATDPDNNISGWEWSVNGESGGGQSLLPTGSISRRFSHTFSTVGSHMVEATFTDKKRRSNSVIWSVRVDDLTPANRPPSVYIVSPSSLLPTDSYFYEDEDALFVMLTGEMQIFEALAEDPDDNLSGWEWRVDGHMEDCGGRVPLLRLCAQDVELTSPTTQAFAWSFDTPGNHEVAVIFTDAEGATGSVSWQISVPDPAELILPEPPQPSVEPVEPDDGKIAYISGVEANRATESDGGHATISLWAITRPSCDYFTAGRPAEENPFMSVKEGLWVRLTVTNPSNFPRKSPIGMKVTYRNDARNIERTREVKRLWPGCAGPDSSDVEMEPQTTRDVYFRVQGPWFYRGPFSRTDGVGRYEYYFRHQEPFKENPDLIVEVVSDEDEIQAPQLSGNAGSGTLVFWQFPTDEVEVIEWIKTYNGIVALFNAICGIIPGCESPLFQLPDPSLLNFLHNQRLALLSTAEASIEVATTGQNHIDVRTEWLNKSTNARLCEPDTSGGRVPLRCYEDSVQMSFDRATAVLEIKAHGSASCPTIETTSSDISVASCESKDGYSLTGAIWHVYGVGNKIVVNDYQVKNIRIRHQTDIEVTFNVYLELGPYRGIPYVDPDGGVIDYSAWRSDPGSVYWLVVSADSDVVHVEGGGIQGVYADGLVIHECGQGNVKVDVVAPTGGNYYVQVFDDLLGIGELALDWEWDSTRSQTHTLAAGEEATMSLDACPDSPLGIFEFRLYRQPTLSSGFSVVDKVKQSLSPYDEDNNVSFSKDEAITAVVDHSDGNITKAEAITVILLYFGS